MNSKNVHEFDKMSLNSKNARELKNAQNFEKCSRIKIVHKFEKGS